MAKRRDLPIQVPMLAIYALPHLFEIFERCNLSPSDLFILTQIKSVGKDYKGRRILLGRDIVITLQAVFRYSASQASKDISKLIDRGLITWMHLTTQEKNDLFGTPVGKRWALSLEIAGANKIDEFLHEINRMYRAVTSNIPDRQLLPFLRALESITNVLVQEHLPVLDSTEFNKRGASNEG